jgi:hypothetical protein
MSWRPEILQDNGKWLLSEMRFHTAEEAEMYVLGIPGYLRETIYYRASASKDPVNHLLHNDEPLWVNDLPPWGIWDLVL